MLAQGPLVNKLTTLPDLIGNAGVLGDEECHFMQEMQSGSWYAYTMSELVSHHVKELVGAMFR